jgi:hypothetical protein
MRQECGQEQEKEEKKADIGCFVKVPVHFGWRTYLTHARWCQEGGYSRSRCS